MRPILVAYATTYGSTREVADAVAATLAESGYDAVVRAARDVHSVGGFSAVVLGGALYFFRWHKHARKFLSKHQTSLANLPVAVFGMGPFKNVEEEYVSARRHLERSLVRYDWLVPRAVGIFGGRFDPFGLKFPHNNPSMKQIPAGDIRDWEAIRAWAETLPEALGLAPSDTPAEGEQSS